MRNITPSFPPPTVFLQTGIKRGCLVSQSEWCWNWLWVGGRDVSCLQKASWQQHSPNWLYNSGIISSYSKTVATSFCEGRVSGSFEQCDEIRWTPFPSKSPYTYTFACLLKGFKLDSFNASCVPLVKTSCFERWLLQLIKRFHEVVSCWSFRRSAPPGISSLGINNRFQPCWTRLNEAALSWNSLGAWVPQVCQVHWPSVPADWSFPEQGICTGVGKARTIVLQEIFLSFLLSSQGMFPL